MSKVEKFREVLSQEKINTIITIINKILSKYSIDDIAESRNNNNAIGVSSDDVNIWIRIMPVKDEKCKFEVSTIYFSEKYRRKGIFTSLYTELLNCDIIEKIAICSVCTPEMESWCSKNELVYDGYGNYLSK